MRSAPRRADGCFRVTGVRGRTSALPRTEASRVGRSHASYRPRRERWSRVPPVPALRRRLSSASSAPVLLRRVSAGSRSPPVRAKWMRPIGARAVPRGSLMRANCRQRRLETDGRDVSFNAYVGCGMRLWTHSRRIAAGASERAVANPRCYRVAPTSGTSGTHARLARAGQAASPAGGQSVRRSGWWR